MPADTPLQPNEDGPTAANAAEAEVDGQPDGQSKTLVVGLLMIVVLLALILLQIRPDLLAHSSATEATAAAQAAIDAERAELDRELASLNLPRLERPGASAPQTASRVESPTEVAKRLAADSQTLAAHAADVQHLLDAKEAQLAAAAKEVLQAQKDLLAMSKQLSALKQQLGSGLTSAESDALQRGAEIAAARTAALEKTLAEANARLAEYAGAPSAAEHANLQGLYQDALRARDFFEKRATELEKQLAAPPAAGAPGPAN
jgi:hypothetical protein